MIDLEFHGKPGHLQMRHIPVIPSIMELADLQYLIHKDKITERENCNHQYIPEECTTVYALTKEGDLNPRTDFKTMICRNCRMSMRYL